jgi:hypothetical protein
MMRLRDDGVGSSFDGKGGSDDGVEGVVNGLGGLRLGAGEEGEGGEGGEGYVFRRSSSSVALNASASVHGGGNGLFGGWV